MPEIVFGFDFGRLSRAVEQDWLWFVILLCGSQQALSRRIALCETPFLFTPVFPFLQRLGTLRLGEAPLCDRHQAAQAISLRHPGVI